MAGSSSVQQTRVLDGGISLTLQRGAERQVAVTRRPPPGVRRVRRARHETAPTSLVFRSAAPDRVVVNHIDSERRELLTASPARTRAGEWRVNLDLASLPKPQSSATSYGAITRPLRIRVRQQSGEWSAILGAAVPADDTRRSSTTRRSRAG